MKYYEGLIGNLKDNEVFVFGSNPEGRHGAGAAKFALMKFGAKYWNGRGIQGNAYALVTKNLKKGYVEKSTGKKYDFSGERSVSLPDIRINIEELYKYATENPEKSFMIAYQANSKNLNGYSDIEIFNVFNKNIEVPKNIIFNDSFKKFYKEKEEEMKIEVNVVNIKSNPDIKKDSKYVYCGRGSALGNPFNMENYSQEERERVCDSYEEYIEKEMRTNQKIKDQLNLIWTTARKEGVVYLGCFCAPQRCHCNTIKNIIDNKFEELKNRGKLKPRTKKPSNSPS